jgi:hypothetical protein
MAQTLTPKVYYHLFQFPKGDDLAGLWRAIWHDQMAALEASGLAEHGCRMGVIGQQRDRDKMREFALQYPWLTIAREHDHSENEGLFEGATLRLLWEEIKAYHEMGGPRCPVLYHHAKGSASMNICTLEWRRMMEYFCVERWRECVEIINAGYDACGVNWRPFAEMPHFSGNFWWASSDYIAGLPDPLSPDYYKADGDCRMRYEFWMALGNPRTFSLHESNRSHYTDRYPRSCYAS